MHSGKEATSISTRGYRKQKRAIDPSQRLSGLLHEHAPAVSLVARCDSLERGTLRYFEVCYADRHELLDIVARGLGDADGRVVFCLPFDAEDRTAMQAVLSSNESEIPVLAALPAEQLDLKELGHELACLRWVEQNTPELESDATARRELRARVAAAENNLAGHLNQVYLSSWGGRCSWYYRGQEVSLTSVRGLNEFLSHICDKVYHATPTWRNELLNRRSLSSSAAKARRNLIEAMIEHRSEERLGIEGFPPERSMYESIVHAPGLHRKNGEIWGFFGPPRNAEPALHEVWKAVKDYFLGCAPSAGLSPNCSMFWPASPLG